MLRAYRNTHWDGKFAFKHTTLKPNVLIKILLFCCRSLKMAFSHEFEIQDDAITDLDSLQGYNYRLDQNFGPT